MPTDDATPHSTTSAESPAPWSAARFVRQVSFICAKDSRARADLRRGLGRQAEQSHLSHRHLVPRLEEDPYPTLRQAAYAVASMIAAQPVRKQVRQSTEADSDGEAADAADTKAAADSETPELPGPQAALRYRSDNLGAHLAAGVNAGALAPGTAESELHLYARQSAATVIRRLPSLIRNLTSRDVQINWPVLLDDLRYWDSDSDKIATRWFDSYFRRLDPADFPADPDNPADASSEQTQEP